MLHNNASYALPLPAYDLPMQTMGDRIRQLREARGLTQRQVGDYCKVTDASVSQWERGATANIKLATFLLLCEVLNTDAQYLIFGADRKPGPSPTIPATTRKKRSQ